MKAVILAAGLGSRLGNGYPKCLTPVDAEKTILDMQVENLKASGIEEIIVVVGYKKELVMEAHPELLYLYNRFFHVTNTAKSLAQALSSFVPDDVIWLNGDVVFRSGLIEAVLSKAGSIVAVDQKSCGDEEVKYCLSASGCISQISKQVENPEGEAVGVNTVRRDDFELFRQSLEQVGAQDYFEKAMEVAIEKGVEFKALDISGFHCIEVDDRDDLDAARAMIEDDPSKMLFDSARND